MGRLDGKVALITGAGSGIGRFTAMLFAREGCRVAVADCDPSGGQDTIDLIDEIRGGAATFVKVDVSKANDVRRLIREVVDEYGKLSILFNNAGVVGEPVPSTALTVEQWDRVLDVNLKGVFLCSKYAIPEMIKIGGGAIINAASVFGLVGSEGRVAYSASKGAVVQLTKTMALEFAGYNIRINCICPGVIRTPMTEQGLPADPAFQRVFMETQPMGRIGEPDAIAQAALYLASEDSSFVTGISLVVDGGWTAGIRIPGLKALRSTPLNEVGEVS